MQKRNFSRLIVDHFKQIQNITFAILDKCIRKNNNDDDSNEIKEEIIQKRNSNG